jgi:NhaA family Na+:H+ antiporter
MKLTTLFQEFFESEKLGGILLLGCTAFSLLIANSAWGEGYAHLWHQTIGGRSVEFWINDGLMTIFFLLIGLELERELYLGELSSWRKAALPVVAALGGMVVPALLHAAFNHGTPTQAGEGIPVATDIAFAIGVLSLLSSRVPGALKIFLTALAVADDLGAILVIAIFYSTGIAWWSLGMVALIFSILGILNRLKVNNLIPYLVGGVIMWYFMVQSGVHPTITGILLAFIIPSGSGRADSPSYILQELLHKPVAFIILPIFALANTSIILESNWYESLTEANSLGILAGLVIGKPVGICVACWLAVRFGWAALPSDLSWKHIVGAGLLAGIGFTMSIFITLLAFDNETIVNHSKIAILCASLTAGVLGFLWLRFAVEPFVAEEV